MRYSIKVFFVLVVLFPASWLASPCIAEVYRYQDEQGRWQFTDKPPPGENAAEGKTEVRERILTPKNLAANLQQQFQPNSPVQQASLAVVAISSPAFQGSGFFISEDGYILTNKHVIDPTETKDWQNFEAEIARKEKAFRKLNKELRAENARLLKMERGLKEYREAIDRSQNNVEKWKAEIDYQRLNNEYLSRKNQYEEIKRNYLSNKREVEEERRKLTIQRYSATVRKRVKIVLKDKTEATARVIRFSDQHDLALLKLDHHQTPFIRSADEESQRQGTKIFVIGNPLGMKNMITAGQVAGRKEGYLILDARILPGNSGSPLITDSGKVAGIVSQRVAQVIGGEGFGAAIPIHIADEEFSDYLKD